MPNKKSEDLEKKVLREVAKQSDNDIMLRSIISGILFAAMFAAVKALFQEEINWASVLMAAFLFAGVLAAADFLQRAFARKKAK